MDSTHWAGASYIICVLTVVRIGVLFWLDCCCNLSWAGLGALQHCNSAFISMNCNDICLLLKQKFRQCHKYHHCRILQKLVPPPLNPTKLRSGLIPRSITIHITDCCGGTKTALCSWNCEDSLSHSNSFLSHKQICHTKFPGIFDSHLLFPLASWAFHISYLSKISQSSWISYFPKFFHFWTIFISSFLRPKKLPAPIFPSQYYQDCWPKICPEQWFEQSFEQRAR